MSGMTSDHSNRDPWRSGISPPSGGLGRLFGEGELWLRWGLPIGSLLGVRVRVHWSFLALIVVTLVMALPLHQSGPGFRIAALGALLLLVMAHECAHVLVCRHLGGEADEVILWPLGGLGEYHVPLGSVDEARVAAAGPMLNLLLLPLLAFSVSISTGSWGAVWPNLLDLDRSLTDLAGQNGSLSWWIVLLWSLHACNLLLLTFNLLLPMLPSDAGVLLRSLVAARSGPHRARWVAAHAGLTLAIALVVGGAMFVDGKLLIAAGGFGAAVCWAERRRLQFLAGMEAPAPPPVGPSVPEVGDVQADGEARADQAELDRILGRISEHGMDGLTARERRVLKRATRRSRETEGGQTDSDEESGDPDRPGRPRRA
ncbi:MAG: site-2 protease family protein [Planctomycetota bacterium]